MRPKDHAAAVFALAAGVFALTGALVLWLGIVLVLGALFGATNYSGD